MLKERKAELIDQLEAELRTAMLLTGCRRAAELAETPRVLGPGLERWLAAG